MPDQKLKVTSENPQGILVDYTEEELAQRETQKSLDASIKEATDALNAQKDADKASAKAKLIAGEALTEAEADTIVL